MPLSAELSMSLAYPSRGRKGGDKDILAATRKFSLGLMEELQGLWSSIPA